MSFQQRTSNPAAEQDAQSIGARFADRLSGSTSTGSSGSSSYARNKGGGAAKEVNPKEFNILKDISSGSNEAKHAVHDGDSAGAIGGVGLNKDELIQKNFEEVGRRLFGTTGAPNESTATTGGTFSGGNALASGSGAPSIDERRSIGGSLEPNYDIRKGPITPGGSISDQRSTETASAGNSGISIDTGSVAERGPRSNGPTARSTSLAARNSSMGSDSASEIRYRKHSDPIQSPTKKDYSNLSSGNEPTLARKTTTKVAPAPNPQASIDSRAGSSGPRIKFWDYPTRSGASAETGTALGAGSESAKAAGIASESTPADKASFDRQEEWGASAENAKETKDPPSSSEPAFASDNKMKSSLESANDKKMPTKLMPGALPGVWDDESDFDSDAADMETKKRVSGMNSDFDAEQSSDAGLGPMAAVAGAGIIGAGAASNLGSKSKEKDEDQMWSTPKKTHEAKTAAGSKGTGVTDSQKSMDSGANSGVWAGNVSQEKEKSTSAGQDKNPFSPLEDEHEQAEKSSKSARGHKRGGSIAGGVFLDDWILHDFDNHARFGSEVFADGNTTFDLEDTKKTSLNKGANDVLEDQTTQGAAKHVTGASETGPLSSNPFKESEKTNVSSSATSNKKSQTQDTPASSSADRGTSGQTGTVLTAVGATAGAGLAAAAGMKSYNKSSSQKDQDKGVSSPEAVNTGATKPSLDLSESEKTIISDTSNESRQESERIGQKMFGDSATSKSTTKDMEPGGVALDDSGNDSNKIQHGLSLATKNAAYAKSKNADFAFGGATHQPSDDAKKGLSESGLVDANGKLRPQTKPNSSGIILGAANVSQSTPKDDDSELSPKSKYPELNKLGMNQSQAKPGGGVRAGDTIEPNEEFGQKGLKERTIENAIRRGSIGYKSPKQTGSVLGDTQNTHGSYQGQDLGAIGPVEPNKDLGSQTDTTDKTSSGLGTTTSTALRDNQGTRAAGGLKKNGSDVGKSHSATSSTSTTTKAVRFLGKTGHNENVLEDRVQAISQKCKTQLGMHPSELNKRCATVDAFFDVVASERLRWMPRDGSRLDCCLRWASRLAYAVDALRESVGTFSLGADKAATLIWGLITMLLESDTDDTEVFERIFGRYGRVAVGLHLLLQYEGSYKSTPDLQPEAAAVFADLLEMVFNTATGCVEGYERKDSDLNIARNVDAAFLTYAKRYSNHWNAIVESSTSEIVQKSSLIYASPEIGSLRQFLGVQDRPLQFILDSRSHTLAEGSFEWFNNTLYDFSVGKSPMLLVAGEPGSGKSALSQWTVERLQESGEHEAWNLIPYSIRADIPVATLPLRILKGILHQMLDHCVSDKEIQEKILVNTAKAAQSALDGANEEEVEESLWQGIQAGLESNIQYMFVVDGLDQIKGGSGIASAFLAQFNEILSENNAGSKMIVFSRPLPSTRGVTGLQHYTIQASQTQNDLKTYVSEALSTAFDPEHTRNDDIVSAVAHIVSEIVARSNGSFSWAEMALGYAQQQRTLKQAVAAVQSLPDSIPELLNFHITNLDLSQNETKHIALWLIAAERPLLVEEIEHLLSVDPKAPSFISSNVKSRKAWSKALSPLIMTRDGVVSFAHTCIRDHVLKQAKSATGGSPFNIREAHYDLLMKCLAWVQLNMGEESEISMDKLSMSERNQVFDKYVVLEYTARYWLLHLLTSHLVNESGDFKFNPNFKKLIPDTVLFSRLELTCRESQFTRSSVVELYRLATDIRRSVLGEKSLAYLQSLLFSAQVSRLAHASHADDHCFDAWKISQELLGQSDAITLQCAEMMAHSFTKRGSMTTEQEDTLRYLILTESEITGIEFDQRLKYLGMIVAMYKASGDDEPGLLLSKQFYQEIVQKYGTNSRQASDTADFLTDNSSTGGEEMNRDIARTKYDNMRNTMDVADDRRIQHSLYMAQLHEKQGENPQAQAVLSSLWSGLNSRDIDSIDMMDKKANVALYYYQYLRRQGRNEEADAIMRELVADLEVTGIHSPEMMQGVRLLRGETHAMQMYDMERSLSILMWHYYKEIHEEYSLEAMSLALWLAESTANAATLNETRTPMSGQDRQLMVELIDSITSSPESLSVSTLILCHNLASNYMREENWMSAHDCSKAALHHIWPTVEQKDSERKFSRDLAPPVADLALILAYCHFRRLHLEQATTVYENAFNSIALSENVPVASVLAVAKAVVEFYETTFQFAKAQTLLNGLSGFLTTRLGQTHKHTIENMYLEASLAKRLEMNSEAKDTYQRIYSCTIKDGKIALEGFDAAIALIYLFEKELQWKSALGIYRHLWPSLATKDSVARTDRLSLERLLEKTFVGYMTTLNSHAEETEFSERHQVSSDYVTACKNVYGPTHPKTLSATLLLAELCESNESSRDQAISLYKAPLETNEWVPTSQSSKGLEQMTHPLPITLKHKLAQLYVRKNDSSSDARALYTEEFQLAKKTQGYYSTTALSWLRELALAHSRQGTPASIQQGNALLHTYVTDILHGEGGEKDMTDDWARKIAAIYLECGFIEGGTAVLDELRQRVMSSPEKSAATLEDRRDAVFVSAFEEAFGRRASSDIIMDEMAREMQRQQEFSKNLSGHDFIPTLISGDRLARLQTDQKRTRAAKQTHDKLYEYFCSTLSATQIADREVVQQFYQICLQEAENEKYSTNILNTTTKLVRDLCNASKFQEASDLTGVLHSYLHLTDGLNSYDNITTATKLCLYLSGNNATKCEDQIMYSEMSLKAKLLLHEIMESSKSIGIETVDLPFTELNDIITLLGEYEMFDELESILTKLWTSRIVQRTWTPDVVVWIGRRLVETRFCRGSTESSIQLCRDICYNLRQVWGSCDSVTLEMTKLLSGLFTASGDHNSAATLHEGALYDLMGDAEAKNHPNVADVASQHMELLKRAQARLGSSQSPSRASAHEKMIAQVTARFALQAEQMEGTGEANGGESFGVWSKPRRFSIDVEDLEDQGQVHHNHLRESSGPGVLHGSGAPRRISVQAL